MNEIATVSLTAICILGMAACGDTTVNKTTVIKKETKTDSDGHEKTKIETKTVETTERNKDGTVTRDRIIVEDKKDPIIKLGPLEIKN
jgi:ABC-type uncharacterized transport system auxiliary subunit